MLVYNLKLRMFVKAPSSNLSNFISYGRLVEQLRKAGEFRPDEEVTDLILTNEGIEYRIK